MADDIAIKVDHVSKTFKLPHDKQTSIKGSLVGLFRGSKRSYEKQEVLKDVSFDIKKGEFFGIVGRNGSGKSTLLKMLAGIYTPTKGSIAVNGKLTPFIELGVGFNPELTGRENVYLNGALLGFNRAEMEAMYDEIVEFAELERFMDQKLKNYSSGMQVRLAFSVAIRAKSSILLIDEVLAVGDTAFQTKCFDYFYELKRSKVTVVFVSHDQGSLERFCDRGVLLENGKMVAQGDIESVLKSYSTIVLGELDNVRAKKQEVDNTPKTEYARIRNVSVLNSDGKASGKYRFGERATVSYEIEIRKPISNPVFGVTIWQKNVEKAVLATNTLIDGNKETGQFNRGDTITFIVDLPDNLNNGEYYVEPAIANESTVVFYDRRPKAARFIVNGGKNPHSIISFQQKSNFQVKRQL